MIRKVIQSNETTLSITLPKKWTRENHIKKGSEVHVKEEGQYLQIGFEEGDKVVKESIIDFSLFPDNTISNRLLRSAIASAYKKGFDRIILLPHKSLSFVMINEIVDTMAGVVISEQNEKKTVLHSIIDPQGEDVYRMINKMWQNVYYFTRETMHGRITKEESLQLSKSVIKMRDYIQRLIAIHRMDDDKEFEYYVMTMFLEKIISPGKAMEVNKITDRKEILPLIDYVENLRVAHNKKDIAQALSIFNKLSDLKNNLYKKKSPYYGVYIEYLFSLSSRVLGVLV